MCTYELTGDVLGGDTAEVGSLPMWSDALQAGTDAEFVFHCLDIEDFVQRPEDEILQRASNFLLGS